MTNPKLVADRIAAEVAQASTLNSYEFHLKGKPITVNEIDNLLQSSTDLAERQAVWESSKESGKALKDGLIKLRDLRNGVAKELDYPDYFALQVAGYGMTTEEMVKLNDDFMRDLRPLYLQLHTWVKYKLAEKIPPARAEAHPGALDQQPLVAGVGRPRRGCGPDAVLQGPLARLDRAQRREILHGSRLSEAARLVLDQVRPLPRSRRQPAQKEHARLRVARRSRERPALAAEHRVQPGMVQNRPP
ncbi:MAG: M2 family metallopeptidase [Lacunisphaera sp.]